MLDRHNFEQGDCPSVQILLLKRCLMIGGEMMRRWVGLRKNHLNVQFLPGTELFLLPLWALK